MAKVSRLALGKHTNVVIGPILRIDLKKIKIKIKVQAKEVSMEELDRSSTKVR